MMSDFTTVEINAVLLKIKNRKAAGTDCILPEFLKNLGIKGKTWLANLCTSIVNKCRIHKEWHEAKIIAILKPNKPGNDPKSNRPISLLSVVYNTFERLLLSRFIDKLEKIMPKEQASFVRGRRCSEQVLSLTTHIENGFQNKL